MVSVTSSKSWKFFSVASYGLEPASLLIACVNIISTLHIGLTSVVHHGSFPGIVCPDQGLDKRQHICRHENNYIRMSILGLHNNKLRYYPVVKPWRQKFSPWRLYSQLLGQCNVVINLKVCQRHSVCLSHLSWNDMCSWILRSMYHHKFALKSANSKVAQSFNNLKYLNDLKPGMLETTEFVYQQPCKNKPLSLALK